MTKNNTAQSISDIANTMFEAAEPTPEQDGPEADAPTGAEDQGVVDAEEDLEEGVEAQADDEDGQDPDQEEDATEQEDGDEEQENSDLSELADDTVFSVTVDGKETEVTLADLKKAYSGEGAISKRLQEATEAKKAVEAERQQVKQELETGREKLVKAFQTFDALMFQPRVQRPDAALQQSDPQKYLLQMERYREDQASLQQRRSQVQSAMQQYEQQRQHEVEKLKAENAQKLVEVLPDLRDPEKGKALQSDIMEAAKYYGFAPAEVAEAYDYRVFQMAADAAAYRKLVAGQKAEPIKIVPKTRVLRPGTAKARQQTAAAREAKATFNQARQTGRTEDVAATMLIPQKR